MQLSEDQATYIITLKLPSFIAKPLQMFQSQKNQATWVKVTFSPRGTLSVSTSKWRHTGNTQVLNSKNTAVLSANPFCKQQITHYLSSLYMSNIPGNGSYQVSIFKACAAVKEDMTEKKNPFK